MSFISDFIVMGKLPLTDVTVDYESFLAGVCTFLVAVLIIGRYADSVIRILERKQRSVAIDIVAPFDSHNLHHS